MASIPLAFSIHNFISSVGADAGFAAIIGLAVLVLLYFAHARETANLREEAALLTQRLMQAEARVAQLSRAQPAAAPAQAAAARPAPAPSPLSRVPFPFAPAGLGAPALAAATRVVPVARVAVEPAGAPQAPQSVPAEPGVPARAVPASIPQRPVPEPFGRETAAPVAAPAPATVAGANGASYEPAGASSSVATQDPPPPPPPPRQPPRGGGPPDRTQLPPLRPPAPRRSRLGRGLAILIGALGVAAVIAVLLIATSGGTNSPRSIIAPRTTNVPVPHKPRPAPAPFSPASVTVAVLNGTNTNQLAHTIGAKLMALGYKEGNLATAPNQSQATTIVSYFPGAKNRAGALHVAASLKLNPSSVQPIDTPTQQVACPSTTPCTANVVVTVGADLANS